MENNNKKIQSSWLKINWEYKKCECWCNMFHKPSEDELKEFREKDRNKDIFICNCCKQSYETN